MPRRAGDDPIQTCTRGTGSRNGHSVWYAVVAPADGTISVSTAGSTYDTVVSAHTGRCDRLGAIACNDDHGDLTSEIIFFRSRPRRAT